MMPNDSHPPFPMAVLGRGFDVIIDKPLVNTLDEARDLLATVDATGSFSP